MVRLKVSVRVIPQDDYTAIGETSSTPNPRIKSERKFLVFVPTPETWYIGTLALEIQKRYQRLYKQELGRIKCLKHDVDDCDLDPELYVADALVDEGRATTDPSDQHVTIKVIQEQRRDLKEGSVFPDLSQVHYQLPEALSRPPVPTFPDPETKLGKRKAEEDTLQTYEELKRVKRNGFGGALTIESIEPDQTAQPVMMIEDSQPETTHPLSRLRWRKKSSPSPDLGWSPTPNGPSILNSIETTEEQAQADERDNPKDQVQPQQMMGVQSASSVRQSSPKVNGLQKRPSLALASSSSKKFLKSRRETYKVPESDIDDTQMSPSLREAPRITPRLVPRSRATSTVKETGRIGVTGEAGSLDSDSEAHEEQGQHELNEKQLATNDSKASPRKDSHANGTGSTIVQHSLGERARHEVASGLDSLNLGSTNGGDGTGSPSSTPHSSPQPRARRQRPTLNTRVSEESERRLSNISSKALAWSRALASEALTKSKAKREGRNKTGSRRESQSMQAAEARVLEQDNGSSAISKAITNKVLPKTNRDFTPAARGIPSVLTTPDQDSPSEQLAQALQASTNKASSTGLSHSKLTKSTNSSSTANQGGHNRATKNLRTLSAETDESTDVQPKSAYPSATSIPERTEKDQGGNVVDTSETNHSTIGTLAPPVNSRITREVSTDVNAVKPTKRVLPPGMTQEQYDQLVKQNAHLKTSDQALDKRKSRRRKTPAIEVPAAIGEPVATRSEETRKLSSPNLAATSEKSASLSEVSTSNAPVDGDSISEIVSKDSNAASKENDVAIAERPETGTATAAVAAPPGLASSKSTDSRTSKSSSSEAPLAVASTSSASSTGSSSSSTPKLAHRASQETPAPSTTSKAPNVQSFSSKQTAQNLPSNRPRPTPSPATSTTTKPSISAATPTPNPRPQAHPTRKSTVQAPGATRHSMRPPPTRPANPTSYSHDSVRTLAEFTEMMRSANNSVPASPIHTSSQFAPPKKSALYDQSSSEDTSSSGGDSDSDSDSDRDRAPPSQAVKSSMPDPTIRDHTETSDNGDEDTSSDRRDDEGKRRHQSRRNTPRARLKFEDIEAAISCELCGNPMDSEDELSDAGGGAGALRGCRVCRYGSR